MNIFLTAVIAICAWQLVCVIVDIITDDNQEKVGLFAFGLWIPVCFFVAFIVKKFKLWRSRKYNCYQLYGNITSKNNSFNGWLTNKYMTKAVADKYFIRQFGKDDEVTESYSLRLLREGKDFKSMPHKSDILTADTIEAGEPGLDAEFLKKFRQEDSDD